MAEPVVPYYPRPGDRYTDTDAGTFLPAHPQVWVVTGLAHLDAKPAPIEEAILVQQEGTLDPRARHRCFPMRTWHASSFATGGAAVRRFRPIPVEPIQEPVTDA